MVHAPAPGAERSRRLPWPRRGPGSRGLRSREAPRAATMNPEKDFAPLTPNIVRALNDKLYEKRKVAALEIEK